MVSAWRNFKNIFPRPLINIIFRPEMLKFHPYSILTGDTRFEFVIYILCVKKSMVYIGTEYFGSFLVVTILLSPYNLSVTSIVSSYPKFTYLGKGSLNNYVDKFCPSLTTYLPKDY